MCRLCPPDICHGGNRYALQAAAFDQLLAAYVMPTQPDGISTLQLNLQIRRRRRNMRFPKPSSQSHKNSVQKVLLTALLLLAPIVGRADEFDDRKNHPQQLIDQANTVRDSLGSNLVNALSKGGAQFVMLGDKADLLMGALDAAKLANNPLEPEDFISRLAGSTQSEESVAWCGSNAIVGFNDSGSFVRTMFPPNPSPSGRMSFSGWSASANAVGCFFSYGSVLAR